MVSSNAIFLEVPLSFCFAYMSAVNKSQRYWSPGSILEGGGQILRNAAALAAITGKRIHVDKIRAGWALLVSCMTPLLRCARTSLTRFALMHGVYLLVCC